MSMTRAACSIVRDRLIFFRQGMGSPFKRQAKADDSYRVTLGGGSILIQRIKHLPVIARPVATSRGPGPAIIHLMTLSFVGSLHLARSMVAKGSVLGRHLAWLVTSPFVFVVMNERGRPQ
jgi:hypothetical protein